MEQSTSTPTLPRPSTPSTPPNLKSARSIANASLNTSSFLSSLKARAGDKESLSKSAKEAMRKLGVNWTALRRESPDRDDDALDHGALPPHSRRDSGTWRARTSYADVQAAVAERRGKGKEVESKSAAPSKPIPIQSSTKDQERAATHSPSQNITNGNHASPSSSPQDPDSLDVEEPKVTPPALSRTTS